MSASLRSRWIRVHPRVCGERDGDLTVDDALSRFIPACAGNANRRKWSVLADTVHPRVCGERPEPRSEFDALGGSSPRVRGTRVHATVGCCANRFIPACAGNAFVSPASKRFSSVHPRVCGERANKVGTPSGVQRFIPACAGNARTRSALHRECNGSSPRVRGTRDHGLSRSISRRFIPACAGNAWSATRGAETLTVHPRVCGERTTTV